MSLMVKGGKVLWEQMWSASTVAPKQALFDHVEPSAIEVSFLFF